jgi:hypothetical protein
MGPNPGAQARGAVSVTAGPGRTVSRYEDVIARLKARGSRRVGNNWQCQSHDDRTPSLSVNLAMDGSGMVLMHCHAGCTLAETTAAIGLTPADLFPNGHAQLELFPKSNYSPVGLDILLKWPGGAERSFIVTSALGRFVPSSGGRERVYSQRQIAAVIVETEHRRAAINELGISKSLFSMHTAQWQEWGVAHKCSTRVLTILVRDSLDCPICKSSVGVELSSSNSSTRTEQLTSDSSTRTEQSSHESAITRPRFFKELALAQVPWKNRFPEGDGAPDGGNAC